MHRIVIAAAAAALMLAGCSARDGSGPARSAEPTSLGNNSVGAVSATGNHTLDQEGVGTNGVAPNSSSQ